MGDTNTSLHDLKAVKPYIQMDSSISTSCRPNSPLGLHVPETVTFVLQGGTFSSTKSPRCSWKMQVNMNFGYIPESRFFFRVDVGEYKTETHGTLSRWG